MKVFRHANKRSKLNTDRPVEVIEDADQLCDWRNSDRLPTVSVRVGGHSWRTRAGRCGVDEVIEHEPERARVMEKISGKTTAKGTQILSCLIDGHARSVTYRNEKPHSDGDGRA